MAFVPLVNGMRVVMEYNLAGQLVVNVYHVTSDGPVATVDLEAVAAMFLAWWDDDPLTDFRGAFSQDIALQSITVTDVSVPDGNQYVEALVTPIPGRAAEEAVPNNVAWVMQLRSTFTGRSRRGRNYYAGLPDPQVDNNIVNATQVTYMLNSFIGLVNALTLEGYNLVVASYVSNGAPRVTALPTVVDVIQGDTIVDSQRRRLPGRGA